MMLNMDQSIANISVDIFIYSRIQCSFKKKVSMPREAESTSHGRQFRVSEPWSWHLTTGSLFSLSSVSQFPRRGRAATAADSEKDGRRWHEWRRCMHVDVGCHHPCYFRQPLPFFLQYRLPPTASFRFFSPRIFRICKYGWSKKNFKKKKQIADSQSEKKMSLSEKATWLLVG